MSQDFVTRLQLQLREAAQRESRRGPARRFARAIGAQEQLWQPALAVATIAVLLLAAFSIVRGLLHRDTTPAGRGPHIIVRTPLLSHGGGLYPMFGSVWAGNSDTGELVRIDPRTHAVRARIGVGGSGRFDFAAGAAWTLDGNTVIRVDPATNRVAARIPLRQAAGGLIAGRGVIWVGNQITLQRVDPARNAVDRTIDVSRAGFQANGIASDGRALYVSRADGTLLVFDARTGARLPSPRVPISGVAVAAARGTVVLVTDNRLTALDVRTGRTLWSADLGARSLNNAAVDGSRVWVEGSDVNFGRDRLWRLDLATGRVTASVGLRDFGAPGMAPVDGRLWLLSTNGVLQIIGD